MSTAEAETTEVAEVAPTTFPVVKFSPTDAAIAEMETKCFPLVVSGAEDKKGYDLVYAARVTVKKLRCEVEHKRVEYVTPHNNFVNEVNADAKQITTRMKKIETHLEKQEKIYEDGQAEIKRKAEAARLAKVRERFDALKACNCNDAYGLSIAQMSDELFADVLAKAQGEHQAALAKAAEEEAERQRVAAEQKRLADEEAERQRVERERLAAERAKLDKEREEQQAVLDAQRKAQEDEAARLAAESKRLADLETKRLQDIEDERLAKIERENPAAIEAPRIVSGGNYGGPRIPSGMEQPAPIPAELIQSDSDKILSVADLIEAIELPQLSQESFDEQVSMNRAVVDCIQKLRQLVDKMEFH